MQNRQFGTRRSRRSAVAARVFAVGTLMAMAACPSMAATPTAPTVVANHETLRGIYEPGTAVASFRGIPYAAPPVGDRRWAAPAPTAPRQGAQRADSFAAACYQDSGNNNWYREVAAPFGADPASFVDPPFSEDCLYLNVWTPKLDRRARLPVMVWIHGGANKNGWSYEPNYRGTALASQGGVVVVSLAYRVDIFGFFGHPELSGSAAPTNFGLLDQIAALRWVRDEITAFGGDPNNVTVFGESAGGADIGYLMTSPLARGLFRRAISQSGGYLMSDTRRLSDAEREGRDLSGAFPDHPDLGGLRGRSAAEIYSAARAMAWSADYGPVVDGISLTDTPAASIREHGLPVDLLIGSNENEDFMYVDEDASALQKEIDEIPDGAREPLAAAASELDVRHARDRLWTLTNMRCPTYLVAQSARISGHRSWVYRFSRKRPGPGGDALLVYHGSEIPYVFDTHDAWLPTDASDRALTHAMLAYWTSFARTGDPNAQGLARWPRFDAGRPQIIDLGDAVRPIEAPDHALCARVAPALYPGWTGH